MISLDALAAALEQLPSDAVKVAVVLMTVQAPTLRADAQWVDYCAEAIGLSTPVIRSSIHALVSAGLVERNRTLLTSVCSPVYTHGARGAEGVGGDEESGELSKAGTSYTELDTDQVATTALPTFVADRIQDADVQVRGTVSWHDLVAGISDLYKARYDQDYDWNGRDFRLLKTVVKRRGTDEVLRRATIMYNGDEYGGLKGPYDVFTLYTFFNRFSKPVEKRARGVVDTPEMTGPSYYGGTGSLRKGTIRS